MFDHPARRLAAPFDECSKCHHPIEGQGEHLRHVGEARRPAISPSRTDAAAFNRAILVAAQALDALTWAPALDNEDRARAVAEALYGAGLISSRPRAVRPRRVPIS
ncbi:hypothetical protein ACQEU6_08465 [Spirillospora sp. CA-108201]